MIQMFLILAALMAVAAPSARAQAPTAAAPVTVFAAASLKDALDEAAARFTAATGIGARLSYAASFTLARQIEAGAPADVFISADAAAMDYLAERKLIEPKTRVDLLGNSLVVVAPKSAPLETLAFTSAAFAAAIGDGRIATGDPASVPAGAYAKAALEKLDLWRAVAPRLAFTDNVRAALVFVAREEAPLGLVYATDARSEPRVKIVAIFPESSHPRIVYPIALTGAGGVAAARLLDFLKGPDGKAIFERHGFLFLAR